jgi:hypothetical protein
MDTTDAKFTIRGRQLDSLKTREGIEWFRKLNPEITKEETTILYEYTALRLGIRITMEGFDEFGNEALSAKRKACELFGVSHRGAAYLMGYMSGLYKGKFGVLDAVGISEISNIMKTINEGG